MNLIMYTAIVCTPSPLSARQVKPPTKFSKKKGGGGQRLDKTSTLRGGCWKRGGNFFSGKRVAILQKKPPKIRNI